LESPLQNAPDLRRRNSYSFEGFVKTLARIFRYGSIRVITVVLTVGLGLYLTLIIVNMGGFVDEIIEAQISQMISLIDKDVDFGRLTDEKATYLRKMQWQLEEEMGLHESLAARNFHWWLNSVTLHWGDSERMSTLDGESVKVKDIIFERMPYTLLLVGLANVLLFFACLGIAMILSTRHGKFWDRVLVSLSPISSAPSWVHGVILLAIFALELRILPFKGLFDAAIPEDPISYALQILRHMVLPVMAIILSAFFQGVYTWRTFFIVHSGEDYVDLAKAKGLSERQIRRKYLLRPTLPSVITSFALMLVSFWEGAIALELLFDWPGIGALFYQAITSFDRPVVLALVVFFAYLLAISVILLDIVYAIIDPRVKLTGNGALSRIRIVRHLKFANLFKSRTKLSIQSHKSFFGNNLEVEEGVDTSKSVVKPEGILKQNLKTIRIQIFKYPMATIGLLIIGSLLIISIYTVIAIPYHTAVEYWHSEGRLFTPRLAQPVWTNFFRKNKWPVSFTFDSINGSKGVITDKEFVPMSGDLTDVRMTFDFDYNYSIFPQDLVINFDPSYEMKHPLTELILITPDGRELNMDSFTVTKDKTFMLSHQDVGIVKPTKLPEIQRLFGNPEADYQVPLQGHYTFQVLTVVFENDSDMDIEAVLQGKVYGLFGTDILRRDLTIAMLWGTPVALAFGIIGSLITTTTTILLAAISAWYGGIIDELLQRITELNITLPMLPIAILVYILYSKSIWVILAVMVLMNVFGSSLKEYRAMFLQFKEAPYIEAAMAYGASNWRIIFKYMLPRIIQVMVPQLVISVPSFVFLEATLAYLGVTTPYLPTWGKVINMALEKGAFWGDYFWVLEPIVLVLITGLAFAFVGFALDKILNPRLRDL
jgi:peptide/nickel transport system permease protein